MRIFSQNNFKTELDSRFFKINYIVYKGENLYMHNKYDLVLDSLGIISAVFQYHATLAHFNSITILVVTAPVDGLPM
jgi:hypothetical protein